MTQPWRKDKSDTSLVSELVARKFELSNGSVFYRQLFTIVIINICELIVESDTFQ